VGRQIIWSEFAKAQLRDIFDYHTRVASERVALRLVGKIAACIEILHDNPDAGRREDLLADYPQQFRYLVEGNYKILYYSDAATITISSVFDCRQNPVNIHLQK
jgi:plasmid stabilization system protein ParE